MSIQWIDLSGLGGLDQLGDGGEGVVYRITQPVGYVYKEYKSVVAAEVFPKGLEVTAELIHQLGDKQSFIGERSAWPEVLVRKNGAFSGFLMKKIPDEFSCRHGIGVPLSARNYTLQRNYSRSSWTTHFPLSL